MINGLLLMLKGFLIGLSLIIPGVSGGTMAMVLGVYERLIDVIGNITKKLKKNIVFILLLALGMVLSVLIGSVLLKKAFESFILPTILLFSGLIIGGMPMLLKKINNKEELKKPINYFILLLMVGIVVVFTVFNGSAKVDPFATLNFQTIIILFGLGIVAAATMVIPGISGSLVLMILGYYDAILGIVSDLGHMNNIGHNIVLLIPFGIGVIVGIILVAKLINYLLKRFEIKTFFAIIGFVISSLFSIFYQSIPNVTATGWNLAIQIIIGIILLAAGAALTYYLGKVKIPEIAKEELPQDEENPLEN